MERLSAARYGIGVVSHFLPAVSIWPNFYPLSGKHDLKKWSWHQTKMEGHSIFNPWTHTLMVLDNCSFRQSDVALSLLPSLTVEKWVGNQKKTVNISKNRPVWSNMFVLSHLWWLGDPWFFENLGIPHFRVSSIERCPPPCQILENLRNSQRFHCCQDKSYGKSQSWGRSYDDYGSYLDRKTCGDNEIHMIWDKDGFRNYAGFRN